MAGNTSQATRFAFVEFLTKDEASAALALTGSVIRDRSAFLVLPSCAGRLLTVSSHWSGRSKSANPRHPSTLPKQHRPVPHFPSRSQARRRAPRHLKRNAGVAQVGVAAEAEAEAEAAAQGEVVVRGEIAVLAGAVAREGEGRAPATRPSDQGEKRRFMMTRSTIRKLATKIPEWRPPAPAC